MHILEVPCVACDTFTEMYAIYLCLREFWIFFQQPKVIKKMTFLDYTLSNNWLYKMNELCVPEWEDHLIIIREVHTSSWGDHFGILKTIKKL